MTLSNTFSGQISHSKSFLLPHWGGITLFNPPIDNSGRNTNLPSQINDHVFRGFSKQLLSLLGVPPLPAGIEQDENVSGLSDWQIDVLMRRRALENAKGTQETLTSIVKLVNQIENMPVKEGVKDDVQGALNALEKVTFSSSPNSLHVQFLIVE